MCRGNQQAISEKYMAGNSNSIQPANTGTGNKSDTPNEAHSGYEDPTAPFKRSVYFNQRYMRLNMKLNRTVFLADRISPRARDPAPSTSHTTDRAQYTWQHVDPADGSRKQSRGWYRHHTSPTRVHVHRKFRDNSSGQSRLWRVVWGSGNGDALK